MDLTGTAAQRDVERRRANSWPPAEPVAHDVHAADLRMARASTAAPGDERMQDSPLRHEPHAWLLQALAESHSTNGADEITPGLSREAVAPPKPPPDKLVVAKKPQPFIRRMRNWSRSYPKMTRRRRRAI